MPVTVLISCGILGARQGIQGDWLVFLLYHLLNLLYITSANKAIKKHKITKIPYEDTLHYIRQKKDKG